MDFEYATQSIGTTTPDIPGVFKITTGVNTGWFMAARVIGPILFRLARPYIPGALRRAGTPDDHARIASLARRHMRRPCIQQVR